PVPARLAAEASAPWQVYAPAGHELAEPLRRALERAGVGGGPLVCLPAGCTEEHLALALRRAQAAATSPPGTRVVPVPHDRGAGGLAKTLRLEAPHLRVSIVHLPPVAGDPVAGDLAAGDLAAGDIAATADRVVAEVAGTSGYAEACYDEAGGRRRPPPPLP